MAEIELDSILEDRQPTIEPYGPLYGPDFGTYRGEQEDMWRSALEPASPDLPSVSDLEAMMEGARAIHSAIARNDFNGLSADEIETLAEDDTNVALLLSRYPADELVSIDSQEETLGFLELGIVGDAILANLDTATALNGAEALDEAIEANGHVPLNASDFDKLAESNPAIRSLTAGGYTFDVIARESTPTDRINYADLNYFRGGLLNRRVL